MNPNRKRRAPVGAFVFLVVLALAMTACAGDGAGQYEQEQQERYEEAEAAVARGSATDEQYEEVYAAQAAEAEGDLPPEEVNVQSEEGAQVHPERLIVTYDDAAEAEEGEVTAQGIDATVEAELPDGPAAILEVPTGEDPEVLAEKKAELEAQPGVWAVDYDHYEPGSDQRRNEARGCGGIKNPQNRRECERRQNQQGGNRPGGNNAGKGGGGGGKGGGARWPNDPAMARDGDLDQDNIPAIGVEAAWNLSKGGVRVGVVDSGCRTDHYELRGKIIAQYDFRHEDPIADDIRGHGTSVSAIVGANTNNNRSIAAVAPNAQIICAKGFKDDEGHYISDVMQAAQYAKDNGAKVITQSGSGSTYNSSYANLIDQITDTVVFVGSVGNNGYSYTTTRYPAFYPGAVGVGATDEQGRSLASFSNRGPGVDLVAPGQSIHTACKNSATCGYTFGGTSAAAPQVAGVAALVWARYPTWTAEQVRQRMFQTATDKGSPGRDDAYGYGLVNAYAAVR